ncbi:MULTISPECIES: SCO family protein [unclassified Devosia]|uniref:SCO family protein n=1 Tax=unclassified Devosia TaxID=196773 RepID=UPI00145E9CE5|nr:MULTISPECIES: SCO family protein [unclassified Devosia]MBJ6988731.1 SCO family protein [Devosia sp. MC521]QMW63132.1 SCO family protein [Devosia sp. MC521]
MSSNNSLRIVRIALWVLVAVAAIGATALYAFRPPQQTIGEEGHTFSLTSSRGGEFTDLDLMGTPSLVFFGYTHCPDVCPVTLAETTAWRAQLGLTQDDLRIIFVSVDPARDTAEIVKDYVEGFDQSVIGLTGTAEDTESIKKAFGAFSEIVGEGEYYTVNHTSLTYIIDDKGKFVSSISYGEDAETAKNKIQRAVKV